MLAQSIETLAALGNKKVAHVKDLLAVDRVGHVASRLESPLRQQRFARGVLENQISLCQPDGHLQRRGAQRRFLLVLRKLELARLAGVYNPRLLRGCCRRIARSGNNVNLQ